MSLTPLRRDGLVTGPGPDGVSSKPPVRNGLPHMPEKSGMDAAPCAPLVADPAAGTNVCPQAGVAATAANIANKRKARCLCTPTSRSWFVGEMVTSGVRACGAVPFQHRCSVLLACEPWASPLPVIEGTSARPAGNLRITTIFRRAFKGGYGAIGRPLPHLAPSAGGPQRTCGSIGVSADMPRTSMTSLLPSKRRGAQGRKSCKPAVASCREFRRLADVVNWAVSYSFAAVLLPPAGRCLVPQGGRNCSTFRNALGREVGRKMNLQFGGLPILVTAFLSMVFFASARLSNAEEEPGTSLALARLRSAQISNLSYQTRFSIPRSSNEPIRGSEEISFDLTGPLRPVILDFQGENPQSFSVNSRELDVAVVQGHIEIPAVALRTGHNSIQVSFVAGGPGFYRRDDFLFTLFVPDKASKSFPCFDQPDLKARFELTLQIPSDYEAVSQELLISDSRDDGQKQLSLDRSQPAMCYLFAFAAGKFATAVRTVDGRRMTMFHRESDLMNVSRNIDAIFQLHGNALSWMESYTGIPYPYEKFDFVILPAFPFSGMEHPGSIFYSDKSLFLEKTATQSDFLARARTISHETAHIWFGDLVTMRWFDDVWLKEVFANFMADKIVGPQFPSINHAVSFFLAHYPS